MRSNTQDDDLTQEAPGAAHTRQIGQIPLFDSSKKHFDTFETEFFQQGEDSSSNAVEVEWFEDLDEERRRGRSFFFRQPLMSAGIVSACLVVMACGALWRSNSHASTKSAIAAPATTVPVVQNLAALPTPAEVAISTVPAPAEPAPNPGAEAIPTLVPAPAAPAPVAQAPLAADAAQGRCEKAMSGKRSKDILAECPAAFAADPSSANIAVTLARIEFDRGRSAQAYAWGKKAIAANPETADAYVFLGGAEQNAGHAKAAKQAYQHYLQLAPTGRYAADLRAIVGSL